MEQFIKLIPSIIVPVITSIITLIFLLSGKKRKGKKGGSGFIKEGKGAGTYEGVDYHYAYSRNGGQGPVSFTIYINCKSGGSFRVTRENKFDKFFIRLGVCSKIKTGELEFDDKFFISSTTEGFTRAFFSSPKNREAVKNINGKGFCTVNNGKTMAAGCSTLKLVDKIDDALIKEIVANLVVLSKDIPPFTGGTNIFDWRSRIPVFAIPILLELFGILTLLFGLINFKPLDIGQIIIKSLGISIPFLFIFIWLSLTIIKGRTSSHIEFLVASIIALTGFPLAGAGGLIFFNGFLDESQAVTHKALVVKKYISKSDDNVTYYTVLKSWRANRDTEKITVRYDLYSRIKPNESEMTIMTKSGKFGFEWLYRYKFENPDNLPEQE